MSNLLRTVAAYVPQSLARAAMNDPSPTPPTKPQTNRMPAAVLFADVSGFTPLTEALGQKGSEGPEELTRILNRYFSWMIAFVEAEGGEVFKFGGDALTVVFPAIEEDLSRATRRAVQAAVAMRTGMDEFGIVESSVGLVALEMKFGIGAGQVLTTQVGGLYNRWEYIIAGDALRQATRAENQTERGEIVLSPEAETIIAPYALPPRPLPPLDWASVQNPSAVEKALRYYVPGPVRSWLDKDLHSWLATLRPMSVMFVGIKGLDYNQPNTVDRLHAFLRKIQQVIYHYWGTLTRLTVDDKGTVLLILFGAPPYSHEDDPERALRCALDLQTLTEGQDLQLAIGVTAGRVFAGPVGGDTRREYTVMGDAVNLAARLMVVAGPGTICCNYEAYRSADDKISFESLPLIEVKGKAGLIPIYRPTGIYHPTQLAQIRRAEANELPAGRQAEVAKLVASLEETLAGHSRIVIIEGEAGIGKSRLVETLVESAYERDLTVLLGMGLSIEQEMPYHPWKGIFDSYFGLDSIDKVANKQAEQQHRVQARVREIAPELFEYLPLLNDVLSLNLPENELTASLDALRRREKLVLLLLALLRSWAFENPLVLILEDAHWLDLPSWKLTMQLAAMSIREQLPLLLVLVMRPLENTMMRTEATLLSALDETQYLRLDSLSADETLTLAVRRMGLTRNELPEAVAELVHRRAGGNPFFAEELFYALHDNGYITFKTMQNKIRCLISDDLDRAAQTLPSTIQSVVLSRLDQLPPEKQLMLRVAAVIGRTFTYTTLRDTLSEHLEIGDDLLKNHLDDLTYLDLIRPETSEPHQTYTFKHVIIREVTYQSLLFDWRRRLHRTVAQWYENTYGPKANGNFPAPAPQVKHNFSPTSTSPPASTPLAPYYSLLVYHWHQAENEEREQHYAALIGEQAVAEFANAEALGYLNRALDLTPKRDLAERYKLLLARETVYDRRGEREAQSQDLQALASLVEKIKDDQRGIEVALRQANYAEVTGDYPAALVAAQQAVDLAKQIRDPVSESKGQIMWAKALLRQDDYKAAKEKLDQALVLATASHNGNAEAESLHHLAVLYLLKGDYSTAQEYCQQTQTVCRAEGQRLIEAHSLNLLGLIHYYLGDYSAAYDLFDQATPIYYTMGDRRGESNPFYNIGLIYLKRGDYEAARDYFEQILDVQREIGDREGAANTLSNLGLIYGNLGDYNAARSYLGHALEIRKEIGSQTGEADTLSKFGFIYHHLGDYKTTRRYCDLALTIQQKIGNQEGESYSLTYLGHALAGINQHRAASKAYNRALHLRRKMGQAGPAIDILAGLAQVAVALDSSEQALAHIEEVLTWIEANGTTAIDNPLWVYSTSHKVLQIAAQGDLDAVERAQTVLATAYTTLQEQAARLSSERLRRTFLKKVKVHQEIITAWENSIGGRSNFCFHIR